MVSIKGDSMKKLLNVLVACVALLSASESCARLGHWIDFENQTPRKVRLLFYTERMSSPTFDVAVGNTDFNSHSLKLDPYEADGEKMNNHDDIVNIQVHFDDDDRREMLYTIGGSIVDALRSGVTGSRDKPAFVIKERYYKELGTVPVIDFGPGKNIKG